AVFFAHELHASTTAIGVIFGAGSIVTAFATLLSPVVVRRLGRVRTVAYLKFLGVPFLALIALAPGVVTAGVAYVLTIVLIGGAFPNKSLTDPIYSLFSMEAVKDRERGTTNGIMHAFSEFPMGVGAWIAGPFMASGNWTMPYCLAGAVYALAFLRGLHREDDADRLMQRRVVVVQRAAPPRGRHLALDPQVRRLAHVGIRGDQLVGRHRDLLQRRGCR